MLLAARGARETDGGTEPVEDDALRAALHRRSKHVWTVSILATIALTIAAWRA